MVCRNLCVRLRVANPGDVATRYERGLGYCRTCEAWFDFSAIAAGTAWCPCCRQRARRGPAAKHVARRRAAAAGAHA